MPYQKVTYLEDLPDIEEVDHAQPAVMAPEQSKISKRFIRNTSNNVHEMSGMSRNSSVPIYEENNIQMPPPEAMIVNPRFNPPQNQIIEYPQQAPPMPMQFSCQDIYYHITDCPMCKKFYKNDNSIYLIIIAILVVFCAILLKKVLE